MTLYEKFKKYEVKADSIEDFCYKYHRRGAFHERGEDYMQSDIESHKEEFETYGYTIIPHGTSTTGDVVSYYGNKEELQAIHTTAFSEYYRLATQPCDYQKGMKFAELEQATEKLNAITDELERRR